MKKLPVILLFVFLAGGISTCKKYPDGPWFSLRTAMARVAGSWKVESYIVNGNDSTDVINSRLPCEYIVRFSKPEKSSPGYCSISCTYPLVGGGTGSWGFGENKTQLRIDGPTNNPTSQAFPPLGFTWNIQRLTNKEMWLKTNYAGNDYYIELKQK